MSNILEEIPSKSYSLFPNDYTHFLLCYCCSEFSKELSNNGWENSKRTDQNGYKSAEFLKELLNNGWEISKRTDQNGYKSAVFINKNLRHIVLAFKGLQLNLNDFLRKLDS